LNCFGLREAIHSHLLPAAFFLSPKKHREAQNRARPLPWAVHRRKGAGRCWAALFVPGAPFVPNKPVAAGHCCDIDQVRAVAVPRSWMSHINQQQ
jgi:hypothetical protein